VVALKQYNLRGNRLRTIVLDPKVEHPNETRRAMVLRKDYHGYVITNLAGAAALVEVCPSATNRCEQPPEQFSVPAYGSLNVPNPDYVAPPAKPADPYASLRTRYPDLPPMPDLSGILHGAGGGKRYLVLKPRDVIVQMFQKAEGTLSTFNVESGITFGSPVPEKK
jgi:hypothetical protein